MTPDLSPNAQAILLLTGPLLVGRGGDGSDLLSAGEYRRLADHLRRTDARPADLLASDAAGIIAGCAPVIEVGRMERLLGRGFLLSQAVERWRTRALWVVSRADMAYPRRLKERLRGDAPPVLYGCGELSLLDGGGLAVVGSRRVDDRLVEYTAGIAGLAAEAGRQVVSGGAKGVDQAAMRGALEVGGRASGVLADSLERQAMQREHRDMLLDGRLTLVSPYDPGAGFNVGHAMQRNKLIYALSDAALVVSSDLEKGGTWAGAVEQLRKLKLVPVYVRSTGEPSPGLDALRAMGARVWPNPDGVGAFEDLLSLPSTPPMGEKMLFANEGEFDSTPQPQSPPLAPEPVGAEAGPAETLFAAVRSVVPALLSTPMRISDVAEQLQISNAQAKTWLDQLVEEGRLERSGRPVRYVARTGDLLI